MFQFSTITHLAELIGLGIFSPASYAALLAQYTFEGDFKSKGGSPFAAGSCSASDNADQGDGQAAFNCTRTLQASELI